VVNDEAGHFPNVKARERSAETGEDQRGVVSISAGASVASGAARFCHDLLRVAVRNRKYFKTNSPSWASRRAADAAGDF
jgi:hypothetical protein